MSSDNKSLHTQATLKEIVEGIQSLSVYLLSKWKAILIATIVGALLGFVFTKVKKTHYTARLSFVLDEGEGMSGALGAMPGLSSMVGIDLGSSGGGIFKGDNIIELYKSRSMIVKTLLSRFNKEELLIDRYIELNGLRQKWAEKPLLKDINFHIPSTKFTIQHDSILNEAVKVINKDFLKVSKPDKKLSIIEVKVETKDENFCKVFTENLVENVNAFYANTKSKKSTDNLKILQKQLDSVKIELKNAISGTATSIDANPNANAARQVLKVPSQNRQIDVKANTTIMEELVKNLELSKVSSRNSRPLIQIIDNPILPLENDHVSVLKGLIIGAFLGGFLSTLFFFIRKVFRDLIAS